ncbi:hypothetical protein GM418_02425 [Maribellus comscasis]|uniref:Uncharacterized protein n=1 Tax=Maribellus comscasis TaxID=2681766 RepID=A0A6I6JR06_9BACT|nr:hypothetical protein [Maribellus comscasis]QGY42547.1 hypothetical protein GM418_02425 [Maribellus comscasis]
MNKFYYIKTTVFIFAFCITILSYSKSNAQLPKELEAYISAIDYGKLGNLAPKVEYAEVSDQIIKVSVYFQIPDTLQQDDWKMQLKPAFVPDFNWAPHLTPTDNHIIAQHVFRSPALIVTSQSKQLALIPYLNILKGENPVDWYMDMDAQNNLLTLGLSNSEVDGHILFVKKPGAIFPKGNIEFGFYILYSNKKEDLFNPWRKVADFFWNNWGSDEFKKVMKTHASPEKYIEHTYNWAFNSWKKSVWQDIHIDGKDVGAPTYIVNTTQSPNYPGEVNERGFRSVWNQAWFSSLRSASGLYRYAKQTNDKKLLEYALKTKELALSFPQKEGFFPGVIATEMEKVEIGGREYNRSKGWDNWYWGNSNRNPYTRDAHTAPYHILDMSFTANQMLLWYNELEKDSRLLEYCKTYADALLKKQSPDGFFPGWLTLDSLEPMQHLNQSPESAVSALFLLNMFKATSDEAYFEPALKCIDAIVETIIMQGRWEDFETYWSCSGYGSKNLVGKKEQRNNQYKQNTLSIFWTAEVLFEAYQLTNNKKYLEYGERAMDELLMYQATWQPPYIYVRAIGGFGVMNADGEWNDARQGLFSELIIRYGKLLNRNEYIERGIAALYASFEMMYCPENPQTKEQWEKAWPFFGPEDYGFMMENYGHQGMTSGEGIGIGEFTIYDWGNGAAAESYTRIVDHFGKDFFKDLSFD